MKLGTTVAALALIGAAAAATTTARADSTEPPQTVTAPPSSLNSQASKPRTHSLQAKSGQHTDMMPKPPATADAKK